MEYKPYNKEKCKHCKKKKCPAHLPKWLVVKGMKSIHKMNKILTPTNEEYKGKLFFVKHLTNWYCGPNFTHERDNLTRPWGLGKSISKALDRFLESGESF